jgi:MinD superfamily P-loop ATPase
MKRERQSTAKAREKIIASYKRIITEINAGKGVIELKSGAKVDAGKSLRKADIYALISADTGMGYSERMIEKYVREELRVES